MDRFAPKKILNEQTVTHVEFCVRISKIFRLCSPIWVADFGDRVLCVAHILVNVVARHENEVQSLVVLLVECPTSP